MAESPWPENTIRVDGLASLIDQARRPEDRKISVSVLWGAGASYTAGIPLASGFVEEIKKRYRPIYDAVISKEYMPLMKALPPQARRNLISPFIKNAAPNWTHLALAQLLKAGLVQHVFTTNFDDLLERACHAIGFDGLSVYDLAAAPDFERGMEYTPALVYLHGKYSGFNLVSTETESEKHAIYGEKCAPSDEEQPVVGCRL